MKQKRHKKLLLVPVFLISCIISAQKEVVQIQREIDNTVWKSFQNAFQSLDAQALNDTYGPEVLRVTPNGIDTANSFKTANEVRFKNSREKGIKIALDFWFDSRHTNESTSYEVGFYRITATNQDGATTYSFGQFHIVLKNFDDGWKIVQDWDTNTINGASITAEDFAKNNPLRF